MKPESTAEHQRLEREASAGEDWKLFGPYLAERQWGTIREDYSKDGACWDYFPHDHARSRAYRWGEDGLLGFSDREARLCFGLALWNGRDPILKERLFGLAAPEGNHGESAKELYYYLDATPTHSYARGLYKYPLWAYPYERLVREGRGRGITDPEFTIEDSGVFERNRYVDVAIEYAKASPTDIAIRITLSNRFGEDALLHVIPQIWFRNVWSWGRDEEPGYGPKPHLWLGARRCVAIAHEEMGRYLFEAGVSSDGVQPDILFTENETNMERLFGSRSASPYVKDAFHERIVNGVYTATNSANIGTKAGAHYRLSIPARESITLTLRLAAEADVQARLGLRHIDETLRTRRGEADLFYASKLPAQATEDERNVLRQGYASLLWSKQTYQLNVAEWLLGDPGQPEPPAERRRGRNHDWGHLDNQDILSVPDKWEYPWYAAWDLAFHALPHARLDPDFAREQLSLLLSDRYLHPSGQMPAYEFAFSDVNPPVHAWACLRVFEAAPPGDTEALAFLSACFDPLMENFAWWKRLETRAGSGLYAGGFLGLDNAGAFERGLPPPGGGHLEQADGSGWAAFFALHLLKIAIELGRHGDPAVYEDAAIACFDRFAAIEEAMNRAGGAGLWSDEEDFYFDHINKDGARRPVRIHSVIGLIPFFAVTTLSTADLIHWPRLRGRIVDLAARRNDVDLDADTVTLAVAGPEKLARVLTELASESDFLGPAGVRSLSRRHRDAPYALHSDGHEYRVDYAPDDSRTQAFGINSNWRGPVWLPVNHLLIEALRTYDAGFKAAANGAASPGGSTMSAGALADEIERRLASNFLADDAGRRRCHGDEERYRTDPHFRELVLFHEYFSGDTGRGFGASHQTGWTALALLCLENVARKRKENG